MSWMLQCLQHWMFLSTSCLALIKNQICQTIQYLLTSFLSRCGQMHWGCLEEIVSQMKTEMGYAMMKTHVWVNSIHVVFATVPVKFLNVVVQTFLKVITTVMGNQLDAVGLCGGECEVDADSDGICDDIDDCVGELDNCGVCNGPGAIVNAGAPTFQKEIVTAGRKIDAIGECGGGCLSDVNGDGFCDPPSPIPGIDPYIYDPDPLWPFQKNPVLGLHLRCSFPQKQFTQMPSLSWNLSSMRLSKLVRIVVF